MSQLIVLKGGFAICYEIISDANGKHYAAKIVPKESIQKPKQKNKVNQEQFTCLFMLSTFL